MAKSRKLEVLTTELNQIRQHPTTEAGMVTLRRVIGCPYGVAVAQAARIVGEFELRTLVPDLETAFERFMVKAKDRDPGCRGKQAIADTLYRLNCKNETLFLAGIRHVQWEPIWGGQADTAPPLRATCALGLVRMNYPDVMVELADLLADPEQAARVGAARAIAYSENPVGVALLRLRLQLGDVPTVLGEYGEALLKLSMETTLPLIEGFLSTGGKASASREAMETAEVMALVLGESRLPKALPLLQNFWQQTPHPELRQAGLLAIATLRQDDALQFLLNLLADGPKRDAHDALKALNLYQNDTFLWPRVGEILGRRDDL